MASPALALTDPAVDRSAIVAIVASAGGIAALVALLAPLPPDFPFPIIVAQHLPPDLPSKLPAVLRVRTRLTVKWAEAGEAASGGTVYLVPPGRQLEVRKNGFEIEALPPSSSSWLASPDALLLSIALRHGGRAIGIMLSGALACGVAGLRAIRRVGGITMAQNAASSTHFAMPTGAIDLAKAEIVLPPARLAQALMIMAEEWSPPPR